VGFIGGGRAGSLAGRYHAVLDAPLP
jgi:hypothetical protein